MIGFENGCGYCFCPKLISKFRVDQLNLIVLGRIWYFDIWALHKTADNWRWNFPAEQNWSLKFLYQERDASRSRQCFCTKNTSWKTYIVRKLRNSWTIAKHLLREPSYKYRLPITLAFTMHSPSFIF